MIPLSAEQNGSRFRNARLIQLADTEDVEVRPIQIFEVDGNRMPTSLADGPPGWHREQKGGRQS